MIFYMSGTGNTLWAAQQLAEATNEELLFIPDMMGKPIHFTLKEGERIGFCFPVHGWRPPMLMRRFIKRLSFENAEGHYCYAVCTAGDTVGMAIDMLKKDLRHAGLELHSAYSLIMPESYVGLPFMDVDTPANEHAKKELAKSHLSACEKPLFARRKGAFELTKGRWPFINTYVIGELFVRLLLTDKPFKVTEARCSRCGACATACPVDNVSAGNGLLPTWKHDGRCLACFACYHHCPHHAIEYGRRTKHKGQYYYHRTK